MSQPSVLSLSRPSDVSKLPLLTLTDVSVTYEAEDRTSVRGIHLDIHEGESVLFLGPSGCGKSTVAMVCAGLIPHAVEAEVRGEVKRHGQFASEHGVGYVFQDPDAQFCMLNVADEIAFGLENQRVPRDEMPKRIEDALHRAGLPVARTAKHHLFSGGMKQKVAIASALAQRPQLMVFDEPTANLDPASTSQVFSQLAALRTNGQTMIVIEHKFEALLAQMDTVVLFSRQGEIYRQGATADVLRKSWAWMLAEGIVAPWQINPFAVNDTGQPVTATPVRQCQRGTHQVSAVDAQPRRSPFQPVLQLIDATVAFAGTQVWQNINLSLFEGEFVAIVGPNGVGKSTLLQVLGGLDRPTAGQVLLNQRPITKLSLRQRSEVLSFCFQNPEYQFVYNRVVDELANQLVTGPVSTETLQLLKEFGLEMEGEKSPFALSQGQKRRLSVATMVSRPHQIYLLDEPTFGQDAGTEQTIMDRLAALHNAGKTVVMTTHDLRLVKTYATRVLVLTDGHLLFDGPPHELLESDDILASARLLPVSAMDIGNAEDAVLICSPNPDSVSAAPERADSNASTEVFKSLIHRLHPGMFASTLLILGVITMFAWTIPKVLLLLFLPVTMMLCAGMTAWTVTKRLFPFVLMSLLYIVSMTLNASPPAGEAEFNLLWWHISMYGFTTGVILAIRMVASVAWAILFLSVTDLTEFIVALCKDFYVPPKFSYASLAGFRVVPLFTSEWRKLRQARHLRGKDVKIGILRIVTYALPILGQAIRMSERVAIAMEARGFVGDVTRSARGRTFYRDSKIRVIDWVVGGGLIATTVIGLIWMH